MSLLTTGIMMVALGLLLGFISIIYALLNMGKMAEGDVERGFKRQMGAAIGGATMIGGGICILLHILSKAGLI